MGFYGLLVAYLLVTPSCVWDSVSNADGIAGGNESLPHARARVKQTTNLDSTEVHNTSCPCLLNNRALSGCGLRGGETPPQRTA